MDFFAAITDTERAPASASRIKAPFPTNFL